MGWSHSSWASAAHRGHITRAQTGTAAGGKHKAHTDTNPVGRCTRAFLQCSPMLSTLPSSQVLWGYLQCHGEWWCCCKRHFWGLSKKHCVPLVCSRNSSGSTCSVAPGWSGEQKLWRVTKLELFLPPINTKPVFLKASSCKSSRAEH